MAKAKSAVKSKSKKGIITKVIETLTGKKGAKAGSKKTMKSSSTKVMDDNNPAHSYGHKKMNLKKNFTISSSPKVLALDKSAMNNLTRANLVQRNESPQRRIISGASLNKKGRLV